MQTKLFTEIKWKPETVQKIKEASRQPILFLAEGPHNFLRIETKLESLNQRLKILDTCQSFCWSYGHTDHGPHLSIQFQFKKHQEALLSLAILCSLQSATDHHSTFQLNEQLSLAIQLCTHKPKWGITELDFLFAEAFCMQLHEENIFL
jgi:pterin-4a-carbinolamine dehydratase